MVGHIIVEALAGSFSDDGETAHQFEGKIRIPFKNENLLCESMAADGKTKASYHLVLAGRWHGTYFASFTVDPGRSTRSYLCHRF